jgi:hypothetical protein
MARCGDLLVPGEISRRGDCVRFSTHRNNDTPGSPQSSRVRQKIMPQKVKTTAESLRASSREKRCRHGRFAGGFRVAE